MLIYILGTGYCGTTVLGLSLGAHKDIIDMGELAFIINSIRSERQLDDFYKNKVCNCGEKMSECEFWGDFHKKWKLCLNKDFAERYLECYSFFKTKYPNKIMVDSSMRLDFFYLIKPKLDNIIPILITKDVRNWSISVVKKHGGNIFKRFIGWYIRNKKFSNLSFKHFKIGYEEFALFPKESLQLIIDFIGLDFDKNMLIPYKSKTHSVWGNPMSRDKNKLQSIFYDYRWFLEYNVCFAFSIMPFIKKLNDKLVYSNNLLARMNYK